MKIMMNTLMAWSCHLFLNTAAITPKRIPSGTETISDSTLTYSVAGILLARYSSTGCRKVPTVVQKPQLKLVNRFLRKMPYCTTSGS